MSSVGNSRVLSSIFEWEIENYSSYDVMNTSEYLCSPSFDLHNRDWYLVLYPSGCDEKWEGHISLSLLSPINYEMSGDEIIAQCAFYLIGNKREVIANTEKAVHSFDVNSKGVFINNFEKKSLVLNNPNVKSSDKIIILCEVIIDELKSYESTLIVSSVKLQYFGAFEKLMNNEQFSDVKFTVENKEMFDHKVVLAANSAVFAAMFENKMRESEENSVTIEDISYEVFAELLRFVYTGECTLSKDIVNELFEAADKYELTGLKGLCEVELYKNLCVTNTAATLQLADMHSAEYPKFEAIEFIALHGPEIIDKPEFEALGNLNKKLLMEVLRAVLAKKD